MPQRISIGFQASPPLALRVSAEDGSVKLNLAHVLWVRTENDEHRVGFGLASSG